MHGRLLRAGFVALLAAGALAFVAAPAGGQSDGAGEATREPVVGVRIAAQRGADGRTEFALQHDPAAHTGAPYAWGERLLPARRFFPASATVGRWLVSSPLTVTPAGGADVAVRIMARLQEDDRIEFAVQQQLAGGDWGEPLLPARRFFPAGARVDRWLVSSAVVWSLTVAPEAPAAEPEPPGAAPFSAVDSGTAHACGLRTDGTISCWGDNSHGQTDAPGGEFSAVSAGRTHSCGLRSDGSISCWGGNENGQSNPLDGRFTAVSAGGDLSCGVRSDGTGVCWGGGFELFDTFLFDPPLLVTAVSAAEREACGIVVDDRSAICTGDNFDTYLEEGEFTAISSGAAHHCGLRPNRTVRCWGDDTHEQAGPPAGRFDAVSAGDRHSCGIRADDTVACWGDDSDGQASPPAGLFSAVSAGGNHSCGLRSDGTVTCWGRIDQP